MHMHMHMHMYMCMRMCMLHVSENGGLGCKVVRLVWQRAMLGYEIRYLFQSLSNVLCHTIIS